VPSIDNLWAIVLAAGQGSRLKRAGIQTKKQFLTYQGLPLFAHSVQTLVRFPLVQGLVLVVPQEDFDFCQRVCSQLEEQLDLGVPLVLTMGGELRQDSVWNGLQALPKECSHVLVHDAARVFVRPGLINALVQKYQQLKDETGIIPGLEVKDTIKLVDKEGQVDKTLERSKLRAVQTPQLFARQVLELAHQQAREKGWIGTDDSSLLEKLGCPVCLVQGEERNVKITTVEDLKLLQKPKVRRYVSGFGYDVHRYGGDKPLILGGIPITDKIKVVAHSDGDVLMHALVDAILGCLGAGDIGEFFPDTDPTNANLASSVFLFEVLSLAEKKGLHIEHVDLTLICEVPKLSPFKKQIQKHLAHLLGLPLTDVGLKATTEEGLGFTGAKQGIKAVALVSAYFEE